MYLSLTQAPDFALPLPLVSSGRGERILAGLIGQAIQKSRTPAMHEAEGQAHGLRYIYQKIDVDLIAGRKPSLE